MADLTLTQDNLYANGIIVEYSDGTAVLERELKVLPRNALDEPYTIKQGDTLTNLAGAKLGNSKLWHVIADNNPQIEDIFNLQIGLDIIIPYLNTNNEY